MDIIKIGAIGITGVLLAVFFRSVKAEYGVYIGVITGLLIFGITLENLAVFMDEVQLFQSIIQADNGFLTILLKIVGITYICEFCAGICRDAGYSSVAGQIEIFGKISILATSSPIILALLEAVSDFL